MVRSRKRSNAKRQAIQILEPEPHHSLPFQFCVPGKPVSHQSKDRAALNAWKDHVAAIADELWQDAPLGEYVKLTGIHFYDCPDGNLSGVPDTDNIMKPIRDALEGIVYVNDFQVLDFRMLRRDLNGSFRVKGMSRSIAWGLSNGCEFVHLLVEEVTDHESLY